MIAMESPENLPQKRQTFAFTLVEVVMSVAIVALIFGGIITANIQLTRRAEWSGQSMAAQALAIQQLEQARSAVWDEAGAVSVAQNQLTQLNLTSWIYDLGTMTGHGYSSTKLDLPIAGTNIVWATNYVTVKMFTNLVYGSLASLSAIKIQMVQVDTVWSFLAFGPRRLFTNTIVNYYAPDNRPVENL